MRWWRALRLISQWRLREYIILLQMKSIQAALVLVLFLGYCAAILLGYLPLPLDLHDGALGCGLQVLVLFIVGLFMARLVASDFPRVNWESDPIAFSPMTPSKKSGKLEPGRLDGRVFVVTGGNRGIGFWTARGLARRGAQVIIASRDTAKGFEAARRLQHELSADDEVNVHFMQLDLSELNSIRQFAALFRDRYGRVDGLIANAGCMMSSTGHRRAIQQTKDGFELQIGVNHVGHCYLIRELRTMLSKGSRIVLVSSVAHALFCPQKLPLAEWILDLQPLTELYEPLVAYGKSKLANILAAVDLQRQLQPLGVTVVSCHPGEVATDLYRDLSPLLRTLTKPLAALLLMRPRQGASTPLFCTLSPSVVPGGFYMSCRLRQASAAASNQSLARDLSALTSQLYEGFG